MSLAPGASCHESHVMQCIFVYCHAVMFVSCCLMNVAVQDQVLHVMHVEGIVSCNHHTMQTHTCNAAPSASCHAY